MDIIDLYTDWWFGTCLIFPYIDLLIYIYIVGIIIHNHPLTDFHSIIFQRDRAKNHQADTHVEHAMLIAYEKR